jgi:hypothetical protein
MSELNEYLDLNAELCPVGWIKRKSVGYLLKEPSHHFVRIYSEKTKLADVPLYLHPQHPIPEAQK